MYFRSDFAVPFAQPLSNFAQPKRKPRRIELPNAEEFYAIYLKRKQRTSVSVSPDPRAKSPDTNPTQQTNSRAGNLRRTKSFSNNTSNVVLKPVEQLVTSTSNTRQRSASPKSRNKFEFWEEQCGRRMSASQF